MSLLVPQLYIVKKIQRKLYSSEAVAWKATKAQRQFWFNGRLTQFPSICSACAASNCLQAMTCVLCVLRTPIVDVVCVRLDVGRVIIKTGGFSLGSRSINCWFWVNLIAVTIVDRLLEFTCMRVCAANSNFIALLMFSSGFYLLSKFPFLCAAFLTFDMRLVRTWTLCNGYVFLFSNAMRSNPDFGQHHNWNVYILVYSIVMRASMPFKATHTHKWRAVVVSILLARF